MSEGWKLLQHKVCQNYRNNQRGSGVGGVFARRHSHRTYPFRPLNIVEEKSIKKKGGGDSTKPPISVEMVTPAAATVNRAKSELKRIKQDSKKENCHNNRKRKSGNNNHHHQKSKKKYTAPLWQKQ